MVHEKYSDIKFSPTNCLICEQDDTELLSVQDNLFRIVRCKRCGLSYQNPRPSEESLPLLYSDDKYFCNPQIGYDNYVKTYFDYQDLFEKLFSERLKLIHKFKKTGNLLEIGCAHGFHLEFLRRAGFDTKGVEFSESPFKYARDILHLDVFHGTLENSPFEIGSFDLILMLDIIEHLPDIPGTLDKVKKLLKPDGLILVQVPWELFHWEKRLEAFFAGKKTGTIRPDAIPVHLYFFTPETLIKVLEKNGFRIISRESGNYGRIRSKIMPSIPLTSDFKRSILMKFYYRSFSRSIMRKIAPLIKKGSGIILFGVKI